MTSGLQLVLVRHGETEWTDLGLLHGRLDSPLSAIGRRHAEQTAVRLQSEHYDALYSSPQGRAMETAEILGKAIGLTPVPVEGLQEADFGVMEGKSKRLFEGEGLTGRLLRPFMVLSLVVTAERPRRVGRRVRAALEKILQAHPRGRLLVVTHWRILGQIVGQLADTDSRRWWRYGPWTACGISELSAPDGAYDEKGSVVAMDLGKPLWRIVRLNEVAHLEKERLP